MMLKTEAPKMTDEEMLTTLADWLEENFGRNNVVADDLRRIVGRMRVTAALLAAKDEHIDELQDKIDDTMDDLMQRVREAIDYIGYDVIDLSIPAFVSTDIFVDEISDEIDRSY